MSEHADSAKTYTLVFLALLALTAITTAVAYVDLGHFSVVVALAIAVLKMLLVALFFMHLRHSTMLTRIVCSCGHAANDPTSCTTVCVTSRHSRSASFAVFPPVDK